MFQKIKKREKKRLIQKIIPLIELGPNENKIKFVKIENNFIT